MGHSPSGLDDEIKEAHERNRALESELRVLDRKRVVARACLRVNRNGSNRPLTERGRSQLLSQLEGAVMRATIILGEQRVLHYGLYISRAEKVGAIVRAIDAERA